MQLLHASRVQACHQHATTKGLSTPADMQLLLPTAVSPVSHKHACEKLKARGGKELLPSDMSYMR